MTVRSPHLVSVKTVAAHLDCSVPTVRRRIADGTIPAVRIGKSIRVDLDALAASAPPVAVRSHTAEPQPAAREAYADYIARVVSAAPPLTSDQVARITTLLGTSR